MSVTYAAVLEVSEDSVLFLSALHGERERWDTRKGTRALGTYKQAVLVLRWFLDDTRMSALARDNAIAVSTAYGYRDEGVAVLAARRPSLHGALLAAQGRRPLARDRGRHPDPHRPGLTTITAGTFESSSPQTTRTPNPLVKSGYGPLWMSEAHRCGRSAYSSRRLRVTSCSAWAAWVADGVSGSRR
jgi:hypothetical protein